MSQAAQPEARPKMHEEWLRAIYHEVNKLDSNLLAQAIENVKEVVEQWCGYATLVKNWLTYLNRAFIAVVAIGFGVGKLMSFESNNPERGDWMNKKQIITALKKLISHEDEVGGDYDSLYFGVKGLIEWNIF